MAIVTLQAMGRRKTQKRANKRSGISKGAIKSAKQLVRYDDVKPIEWYRNQSHEVCFRDNGLVRMKKLKRKEVEWEEDSIKEK